MSKSLYILESTFLRSCTAHNACQKWFVAVLVVDSSVLVAVNCIKGNLYMRAVLLSNSARYFPMLSQLIGSSCNELTTSPFGWTFSNGHRALSLYEKFLSTVNSCLGFSLSTWLGLSTCDCWSCPLLLCPSVISGVLFNLLEEIDAMTDSKNSNATEMHMCWKREGVFWESGH